MHIDALLSFSVQQALAASGNSTNVYDAVNATKLFAGNGGGTLAIEVTAAGGTSPTFQAQLIGADSADLATNPVVLADTGTSAAIAAADLPLLYELEPNNQAVAKRYYGVKYTLGGTSPTATVNANVVYEDAAQNNMVR